VIYYLVNELGANVCSGDSEGRTALFYAAQRGNVDVVRCLVQEPDSDVNQAARNLNGDSPFFFAATEEHMAVV
jgi:ankyrin repeat protein